MNIKNELTCKHCNQIYNDPITLNCCGELICKHHIEEAISKNSSNKFLCPLCDEENTNQRLNINRIIQKLVENELHKFEIDSEHKIFLRSFKKEIANLEALIREPENVIYDEINELKREVDFERRILKIDIDSQADGLIKQLNLLMP